MLRTIVSRDFVNVFCFDNDSIISTTGRNSMLSRKNVVF